MIRGSQPTMNNYSFQRCLLYLDGQGRLYNLTLSNHSIGPASRYMEYLTTFSNMEAIIALTILCRSAPCIFNENTIQNLKPAYLSLVLGLVLTEEISLSWLNASMMIRATPSISAHTLYSPVGSDTFRRIGFADTRLCWYCRSRLPKCLDRHWYTRCLYVIVGQSRCPFVVLFKLETYPLQWYR